MATPSTALATRPQAAPEWAGPIASKVLEAYPESKFNQLVPTQAVRQINPYLVPDIEVVQLSTNEADGDIYRDSQMKEGHYAPTAKALSKLANVAGVTMLDSRRMDNGRDPEIVEWRVEIEMTLPSGRLIRAFGSKRIDLHTLAAGWTSARKAKMQEHLVAMAETKAFNRAIRSVLSLHGSMPRGQLAKPFAILRWVPNMREPDVRQAFLGQLAPTSARLFGPAQDSPQLTEQEPIVVSEAPDDDQTPAGPDPALDTQTGEVIEEPDWAAPAEEAGPSFGERFIIGLRERAEASQSKGSATPAQRDQLRATLRGLGVPNVVVVLKAAFNLSDQRLISAAQADAILDAAEGKRNFGDSWREAAEELASEGAGA